MLTAGYHFTQMRTRIAQLQKYKFYLSLQAGRQSAPLEERLSRDTMSGVLDIAKAQEAA